MYLNMKEMFAKAEEETSIQYRAKELLEEMKKNGFRWANDWMMFSDVMVSKLERSETLEEYDAWRVSCGKIPMIRRFKRVGRDHLMGSLKIQQEVDAIAYECYMSWRIQMNMD